MTGTMSKQQTSRIDNFAEGRGTASNDVNMLVNTGGRQRSRAEFEALYDAADQADHHRAHGGPS